MREDAIRVAKRCPVCNQGEALPGLQSEALR